MPFHDFADGCICATTDHNLRGAGILSPLTHKPIHPPTRPLTHGKVQFCSNRGPMGGMEKIMYTMFVIVGLFLWRYFK